MATKWHATCPNCGKPESTEVVAEQHLRFESSQDEIPSHRYAICPDCLILQRKAKYEQGKPWTLSKIPLEDI